MRIVVQDIRLYQHRRKKKRKLAAKRPESNQLDYEEYLKDPAGYFLRKEHWSLDG